MNRSLISRVAVFLMVLASLIPVSPARADTPFPDADQDGLPNEMETSGWYNLSGGPFVTDPFNADSDGDGLTDGEEKLFGTDPLDYKSPGIYVRYQDSFKTKEYFSSLNEMELDDYGTWVKKYLPMLQGGDKYLMTDAMVVRRGTTLRIGGPFSGTVSLASAGLTTLTPVTNTYSGDWSINIPITKTISPLELVKVGTYTATISVGSTFSKSMPIYVIFELPTPSTSTNPLYNLPEEGVQALLYDDDPADKRDEVSVWWRTPEWSYYLVPPYTEQDTNPNVDCSLYPDSPCSNWQYHHAYGYAQAFWTEQFTQKVFVHHAIDAIQGQTTQAGAVNKIVARADREFQVVYTNMHNSWSTALRKWWDGTGWTMNGGACQDNANVYTTLLRSAGVPARTFLKDYNKTAGHGETGQIGSAYEYDHSVLVWLNGHWMATRSYNSEEKTDVYYPWDHGYILPRELYQHGYTDDQSDLLLTANGKWDWQNGSSGGGMVNTVWDGQQEGVPTEEFQYPNNNWDYDWNSLLPLEIKRTPYMDILNYQGWYSDTWAPSEWRNPPVSNPAGRVATQTYYLPTRVPSITNPLENWPYNPKPTDCSPSTPADVCAALVAAGVGMAQAREPSLSVRSSLASTQESPYKVFLPAVMNSNHSAPKGTVQLGEVVSDQGQDLDGDGRFDELVAQVEVTSDQAGVFRFGGWLQVGEHQVRAREDQILLTAGAQTVQISFDGQEIGDQNASGPYRVINLWVAEPDQPIDKMVSADSTLDYKELGYSTAPYKVGEFTVQAARFTNKYSHQGLDDNGDGYYESLAVYVPLNIGLPGTFQVQGDLYDGRGNLVGHADWTGSDATAVLSFKVAKTHPPYTLDHLMLLDSNGRLLDARFFKAYEITDISNSVYQGPIAFGGLPRTSDFSVMAVTATQVFASQAVDTNGNGRFDKLVFTAGVTVTDNSGDYRIEGALVDQAGNLVAWSVSDPQSLSVGNGELTLSFDGRVIHDHLPFSPVTQTLKLMAVKIYSGDLSPATLEDQVPVAMTTEAYTRDQFDAKSVGLFEDNMERGAITTNNWTKQTPPWSLNSAIWHSASNAWQGSGVNGWLTSAAVSLTDYVKPALRFDTAYRMANANQKGYLEASTDGAAWTRVATYTNSTRPWTSQYFDLSNYGGAPNLQLRFNITSTGVMTWYVDDVYLNAWPAVTGASFTYSPQPALVGANTTFTASYTSPDATTPITYTWDWGDGSPVQATTNPVVIHRFPNITTYTVQLTVENPYDSATFTQLVQVDPASDLSVTQSDSPDPVIVNNDLTYQITVTNLIAQPATNVVLTDVLPSGVNLVSATPGQGSCVGASTLVCALGNLSVGNNVTISVRVNVTPAAARTITNTVTVSADELDFNTPNNTSAAFTLVNHFAPVAVNNSYGTNEDTPLNVAAPGVLGNDTDADGDSLSAVLLTSPAAGALTFNANGSFIYTPTANYNGSASFTYKANDGGFDSNIATVTITINPVNDAPTDISLNNNTVPENQPSGTIVGNLTTADPDIGDTYTYTLASGLGDADNNSFTIAGSTLKTAGTFDYETKNSYTIRVRTTDRGGLFYEKQFTITVTNVNEPPTFVSTPVTAATQDALYTYAVTAADVDMGDTLAITAPAKPAWLTLTDHGDGTATLSGTPTNANVGQNAVTLQVRDTGGMTATQSFTITVANVNDAPQFTSPPVTGATQGVLYAYNIVAADIDVGDHLTITAPTRPGWLVLTDHHDGTATLSGTPTNADVGQHAVTLQARDIAGATATQSFTITVKNVNDAPVAVNDSDNTDEDTPLVAPSVLGNDTDPDHDPLTAVLVSGPTHGALTLNANGSFVYTPTANYYGSDSFAYKANDTIANSNIATVYITVNPVNDAPVAVDDAYLVVQNEVLSVNVPGVLSNDSDVEHSPLTAILVSGPAHGTLTLNADGSFTYTPDTDDASSDSFTYQANDGTTSGNIATVTISILPKTYVYLPIVMR